MRRVCFLVVVAFVSTFVSAQKLGLNQRNAFRENEIVREVIDSMPTDFVTVMYPNNVSVAVGDILTPTQVQDMPWVTWDASYDTLQYYTLVMTDPDLSSNENSYSPGSEFLHWLVVNIPCYNISPRAGNTMAEYIGAGPGKDTGFHRYVFLVFKQPKPYKMAFDEPVLTNRSVASRTQFSARRFARKYNMGEPVAGNFFLAEWDDYVPDLYRQLHFKEVVPAAAAAQRSSMSSVVILITGMILVLRI